MNRVVGILISAASLYVAVWAVTGLDFDFAPDGAWLRFALVALIFGLVNSFVRPILRLLTLPDHDHHPRACSCSCSTRCC